MESVDHPDCGSLQKGFFEAGPAQHHVSWQARRAMKDWKHARGPNEGFVCNTQLETVSLQGPDEDRGGDVSELHGEIRVGRQAR
jgi:hypothetical protein